MTSYSYNNLSAVCPVCGSLCDEPVDVFVEDFETVYAVYDCNEPVECQACEGEGEIHNFLDVEIETECDECGGSGVHPCRTHFKASNKHDTWEE